MNVTLLNGASRVLPQDNLSSLNRFLSFCFFCVIKMYKHFPIFFEHLMLHTFI
ncbi:hypothetical protein A4A49_58264, partial [Nicotiana attenuata]